MPTFLNNFHIWEQQKNKKKMMFTCTWPRKRGQQVPAARTRVCGLGSIILALLYTNLTGYWMNTEACGAAQAIVQPQLDIVLCELPTHRGLAPGTPSPPWDGLCSPMRPLGAPQPALRQFFFFEPRNCRKAVKRSIRVTKDFYSS